MMFQSGANGSPTHLGQHSEYFKGKLFAKPVLCVKIYSEIYGAGIAQKAARISLPSDVRASRSKINGASTAAITCGSSQGATNPSGHQISPHLVSAPGPTFYESLVERMLGGTQYFAQNSSASILGLKRSEDENLG